MGEFRRVYNFDAHLSDPFHFPYLRAYRLQAEQEIISTEGVGGTSVVAMLLESTVGGALKLGPRQEELRSGPRQEESWL